MINVFVYPLMLLVNSNKSVPCCHCFDRRSTVTGPSKFTLLTPPLLALQLFAGRWMLTRSAVLVPPMKNGATRLKVPFKPGAPHLALAPTLLMLTFSNPIFAAFTDTAKKNNEVPKNILDAKDWQVVASMRWS